MLELESLWLNRIIKEIKIRPNEKILNFGSQSLQSLKDQPYIYNNVIAELEKQGTKLINFDIKEGKGIDVSGNIFDDAVFEKLKSFNFSYILLLNVLEHVTDVQKICDRINDLMDKNSKIIITVPYNFPCHFDPIDNGLRPSVSELAGYFPNLILINGEIITDHKYTYYLLRYWRTSFRFLFRIITPFYKFITWKMTIITKIPYMFKNFKVTCIVLEKR